MTNNGEFGSPGPAKPKQPWENITLGDSGVTQGELEEITLGTKWREGERYFGFTGQNSAPKKLELNLGTTAVPYEGIQPNATFSRVMSTPKGAAYTGDGVGYLSVLRVGGLNLESSTAQLVGVSSVVVTESSHEEGPNALADAFAGYFVGISRKGTRTGGGVFIEGRRETAEGRITAAEIISDNEVAEATEEFTGAFPKTKGIHGHATGLSGSAVFLLSSNVGVNFHTYIGAMTGAKISANFIADFSEAPVSYSIGGKHTTAAFRVLKEAGQVIIGRESPTQVNPLLEVYSETTLSPMVSFGSDKNVAVSGQMMRNSSGNVVAFACSGNNNFLTGTVAGDTGFTFTTGKTLHIGAATKTSMLRIQEAKLGLLGAEPVAKAAAIGNVVETAPALASFGFTEAQAKEILAKLNKALEAIKAIGITA